MPEVSNTELIRNVHSFSLIQSSQTEVISTINNLNIKKASGLDRISVKITKENARSLSFPITKIVNQTIRQGLVPAELKKNLD